MLLYVKEHIWQVLLVTNYFFVIITAISIFLSNIHPTKTLIYLLILTTLPYIGLIIYYFFGQEYRKHKIFKRKNISSQERIKSWHKSFELYTDVATTFEDEVQDKIKLVKLLRKNDNVPLTKHNKVEVLINGTAKFEKLFRDIENATVTIHIEYYIIEDDVLGTQLIDLLCKKATEGVKVRVSYDYVGSSIGKKSKQKLRESGVEFYAFMPVYFPRFTSKLNYRNHRKIVVIDGKIGYVGGINVSDKYVNRNSDVFWRDTHLRIVGEAVGSLQLQFMLHWDFLTDHDIVIEDHFFPKNTITDVTAVQIAASGPDTDWANIMEVMFTAIATAEKYIYITTPYFIPNDEIITALTTAAKGGVDVKLIIPDTSDAWIAKYATFSFMDVILKAGVKVYYYKKGFIHAKVMIVDDVFTTIGTSNIDYRSFTINFEINALIYNKELTAITLESFNEDLMHSEMITLKDREQRKLTQKLKESFCRLWAPLL